MTEPTTATAPLLEVAAVTKKYFGVAAVSEMSLAVQPGETVAIIGPNGAGKSTFFGLISGEHVSTTGRITLSGADITRWPAHRRAQFGMSRTFQVARLFPTRTVREHLQLSVTAKRRRSLRIFDDFERTAGKNPADDITTLMSDMGLTHVRDVLASDLPQGDRKRLELAMAMVQHPKILLLDEPTAGMSNEDCDLTVGTIDAIRRANPDLAIVLTGHDMQVLFSLAHRVVLMAGGKLVLDGTPEDVASSKVARDVYLGGADA
jgi:branched-chain amino acid transport system ATP-binding protein